MCPSSNWCPVIVNGIGCQVLTKGKTPSFRRAKIYMTRPANALAHTYIGCVTPLRDPGKPNSLTVRHLCAGAYTIF